MINQHFNWNLSWCGLLCFGIRILCSVSVLCNKSGSHWKHKLWAVCAPKDLLSPISSYILRQLFDKIENFPGFLPFLKFDMSCVEKRYLRCVLMSLVLHKFSNMPLKYALQTQPTIWWMAPTPKSQPQQKLWFFLGRLCYFGNHFLDSVVLWKLQIMSPYILNLQLTTLEIAPSNGPWRSNIFFCTSKK